jgi:hypothetical protein
VRMTRPALALVAIGATLAAAGAVRALPGETGPAAVSVAQSAPEQTARPSTDTGTETGTDAGVPGVVTDHAAAGHTGGGFGVPPVHVDPHHGVVETLEFPRGIVPVRIEIPAIGVDAPTIDLKLNGPEPEVPTDFDDTGWYRETRKPGEIGPSVIAGHVDSRRGPAVFFDLVDLVEGDLVIVHGEDGDTRTFEVVGTGQYDKYALPPEVFGFGEGVPELRLITCGGNFDRSSGHYEDNYVVYTRLVPDA